MSAGLGATRAEWIHFAFTLGLAGNLLPCVPAVPGLKVAPGSKLDGGTLGKIPSAFNADGYVHGLAKWSTRNTLIDEVDAWSQGERYNVCVRTGKLSGIFAFDLDISDSSAITTALTLMTGCCPIINASVPRRARTNASKLLIPFSMGQPCSKRIINTAHGRIELLGDGQQFVAAGTHSSGVRYDWVPGLPSDFPRLSLSQLDLLWDAMSERLSIPSTKKKSIAAPQSDPTSDTLRTEISDSDWNDLTDALRALLKFAGGNVEWSEIGYSLLSLQRSRPARQLWLDFSAKADGFEPDAAAAWWSDHSNAVPRSDYRHIFRLARAEGWRPRVDANIFALTDQPGDGGAICGADGVQLLPPEPTRPICRVTGGSLPELLEQCQFLLVPELYVNAGSLVKAGQQYSASDDVRRDIFQPVPLLTVSPGWLASRLTQLATWQRFDARTNAWVDIDCPDRLADKLYNLPEWPRMRPLDAVVSAPFMREDGSICETPGYDAMARAIYAPDEVFAPVPVAPTREECEAALDLLLAPFDEFPFADPVFRSAFLAHILSEITRLAVNTCPMFWYTAQIHATGKGLLSEMACYIAHGHAPTKRTMPKEDDEMRKQIFSAMLSGDRSVTFDNLSKGHKIRSDVLCAVLTSEWWADRVLGKSQNKHARNLMVLVATGNNVTPVGDMSRRSIVVRMVSDEATMKSRRFKIPDLLAYVFKHRAELLVAALTVLRGYRLHGTRGEYPPPVPSFERWSRHVRNPILWMGLPDPVESQETETDDETGVADDAFAAIAATYGKNTFTAGDISRVAGIDDRLNRALVEAGCKEPHSPNLVGYWLRDNRDVSASGYRLVHGKSQSHKNYWQLIPIRKDPQ